MFKNKTKPKYTQPQKQSFIRETRKVMYPHGTFLLYPRLQQQVKEQVQVQRLYPTTLVTTVHKTQPWLMYVTYTFQ